MPAQRFKFIIISTALLLGFSPLFANEDKLEDQKASAVQDWVLEDVGNDDPPAVSGAESDKAERPVHAHTDTDGEKAPGASAKRGASGKPNAAKTTGTAATNPPETPSVKRHSQHGSPKVAAGQDGKNPEKAESATETKATETKVTETGATETKATVGTPGGGNTTAKETVGQSGVEKRNADDDGEAGQAEPDHQEAEISQDDPMDRDRDADKMAVGTQGDKQVGKGAIGETPSDAPNSRRRLFYGKIGSTGDEVFPSSPGIDRQKEFWILIFTRYSTQEGVIHDGRIATPIFQDLNLKGMGPRTQTQYIKHRKRQLAVALKNLAEALRTGSQPTEKQLALKARMPKGVTAEEIVEYAGHLHFQRGLSDRFREGIIRSGALMGMMRRTMARYGLPEDLVYLPHVESSFVNATLSRSGARGIWQFTRGTGRRYMRVGYLVDQRLDPVVATRSAARFLRRYHNQLKSWPLTISSYNHGPVGIKRLIRTMGTRDLGVMIRDYEGPWFRFASKNFYAEFLAAREIARNHRRYFGELKMDPPMRYGSAKLPYYVNARDAARALRISLWRLRRMNPALRRTIWRGIKRIPKGYVLRIPAKQDPLRFVAAIPKSARHNRQAPTRVVRVRRGDTLIGIGRRHGIPWRRIAAANNIRSGRIRRGQRLMLPLEKRRTAGTAAVASLSANRRIKAGKTALASSPPGKSNPVMSVDDAGLSVSHLSAIRSKGKSGTNPSPTVSTGHKEAGGQTAAGTHNLGLVNFDSKNNTGRIVAVFGESLGHYAEWGNISVRRLRRLNGFSSRRRLRNGEYLLVFLNAVSPEDFTRRRLKFHRKLQTTFFAENNITERRRVAVKRGQSAWKLARKNNVPLWLFFRENPGLLKNPMRIGMEVVVPVVEAIPSR